MKLDFSKYNNVDILDRICEVYGFQQKNQLANHYDIAASSLSNRYRRGPLSYDFAVFCSLETGASISWLITGEGPKFTGEPIQNLTPDTYSIPYFTLSDGELNEVSEMPISNYLFSKPYSDLVCVKHDQKTAFVERGASLSDGQWIIAIDDSHSIRDLALLPGKKIHVTGGKISFECSKEDITLFGRITGTLTEAS